MAQEETTPKFSDSPLNESLQLLKQYMAETPPHVLRKEWEEVETMFADPPEPLQPYVRHPNRKPYPKRDQNKPPSPRALRLRKVLEEMPQEEFDERLARVKALNMGTGGPTLSDYFERQRRWQLNKRRYRLRVYCANWRYKHMLARYDYYTNPEL